MSVRPYKVKNVILYNLILKKQQKIKPVIKQMVKFLLRNDDLN